MKLARLIIAASLCCGLAHADGPTNAIDKFELQAEMGAFAIMTGSLAMEAGNLDNVSDARGKIAAAKSELDVTVVDAIRFAKKNPDLVKAIKDYYVVAGAYLDAGIPSGIVEKANSRRLESDMKQKESALDLERKLAKQ